MPLTVVPSSSTDAQEIAILLQRSITELCVADHGSDPDKYGPWLANKTAENVRGWIEAPGRVFSALDGHGRVIGVAMGSTDGEVLLNYVLPEARFSGVSKRLMRAVENYFVERGLTVSRLKSTQTAAWFYRSIGYVETGEKEERKAMTFRQFEKALQE
ncbi:GNAT family N-acetyltransferase [Roseibium salinum]|uniref:GNAT family N-acetyltransferase n=1 Tax=Roseibium salinum TaxID=1604349 RepID=A0ABT3R0T0_9HYPH|nr:GNAT family N-acetyltransferase [Roseibium sp. DSM 29163]MCX2722832.1 GNAT family N-acetyltransferase [Roseibium sp. DSM 29163]